MRSRPPPRAARDTRTPAERVYARFGGVLAVVAALDALALALRDPHHRRNPATVYRWNTPRAKGGTGGRIPSAVINSLKHAAERSGIKLVPRDFF